MSEKRDPRALTGQNAGQRIREEREVPKGAEAYGFRGDVWSAGRVAKVIEWTFGVKYHPDYVGRLLREKGWSRQQPAEQASQRDEEAIKEWKEELWPALKKSGAGEGYDPPFLRPMLWTATG